MLKIKFHVRFCSQKLDGSAQTRRYSPSLRCRLELELLQFTGHFALGAGDAYKIGFVALERLSGDY
jgi:hypothetical protein